MWLVLRTILCSIISVAVVIIALPIWLLVRPLSRSAFRQITLQVLQPLWFRSVSAILPHMNIARTGEWPTFDKNRPCVILANHQVDSDFFVIWRAFEQNSGSIKIVLKASLSEIPVIGWGIKAFDFLFLSRKFANDQGNLRDHFTSFVVADQLPNIGILIFPEGTTLNARDASKCDAFALRANRPRCSEFHNHLLLPRSKGFATILESLSVAMGADNVDVFDLTVVHEGYGGEVPTYEMGYDRKYDHHVPSMEKLLRHPSLGQLPGVFIHSVRHTASEILQGEMSVEEWLDKCWVEKGEIVDTRLRMRRGEHRGEHRGERQRLLLSRPREFSPTEIALFGVLLATPFLTVVTLPFLILMVLPLLFWVHALVKVKEILLAGVAGEQIMEVK